MTATSTFRSRGGIEDLDLLAELWGQWMHAGRVMPRQRWDSCSGVGEWTVRELYGHVGRGVSTLAGLVAQAAPGGEPELPDAAAYFGTLMTRGAVGAHSVAAAATEWAATRTVDALVDDFDGAAASALADARSAGIALVPTIAGTMRTQDYVLTRILEATTHLLDLRARAGDMPQPSRAALSRTVDVVADLTPAAELIKLATGRPTACRVFPVLT